jgi:ClpP class serine protease
MGQGRVLGADAALEQNMVDGIVTLDEAIRKMLVKARAQAKTKGSRIGLAAQRLAIAEL